MMMMLYFHAGLRYQFSCTDFHNFWYVCYGHKFTWFSRLEWTFYRLDAFLMPIQQSIDI